MASKNSIQVLIGGTIVRIGGFESEEYLQRVASYLSHKMTEIEKVDNYNHMTSETKSCMVSLNIADDYFKAKTKADELNEELQAKDREIYELKHEIINLKTKLDKRKGNN